MKFLVEHINYLGYLGSFLSNITIVPLIVKIIKTKHVRDISIWSNFFGLSGNLVWLTYGFVLHLRPVLFLNFGWIFINLLIISLIVKYKDNQ